MDATTLDPAKLDELRAALLERRDQVQAELDRLNDELQQLGAEQEIGIGALGNHLAEDGSNVMEQERILAVTGDLQDLMAQVNTALERMDEGTYGSCRRCGKPINPERLEAFPYVAHCIECQSQLEREHAFRQGY